jgi:hypothetical protein
VARQIPYVADGALHVPEPSGAQKIAVGSPFWIAWLTDPATRSFSFRGSGMKYMARKERRSRGGEYWSAYRRQDGRLRKAYLGKAEDITLDRLDEAAVALAGHGDKATARPPRNVASGEGWSRRADAAALVDHEVSSASEEELQLGYGPFLGGEFGEVPSHAGLVGDEAGVSSIGFGLSPIGVAGALHDEAGNVEDLLFTLPQKRQEHSRASTGLVDGPHDLLRDAECLLDERREAPLVVFDPAGEHLLSRGVEGVSPVELLSGIDADPHLIHEALHPSLAGNLLPPEEPADGSLCSESSTSPISISGQGLLERGRGAIPFKPSYGGDKTAILGPLGRHSGTVPERQTQR